MTISFRRAAFSALAVVGVTALLAGCGQAPPEEGGSSSSDDSSAGETIDFLPCMVSDSGGFDDHSFNQEGYEGLVQASDDLKIDYKKAESQEENDYMPNMQSMVDAGCDLTISVGFNLKDATEDMAEQNPDLDFAIIDNDEIDLPNVKPLIYDTAQAAFLAGYAAASYTTTGVVGTFGGMNIPTVTIFMDGFVDGVNYYNEQKDADITVLGWNIDKQDGTFTGEFEANNTAKNKAQGLIDQNADVILPVGGPIYTSAAAAISEANDSGKDIVMLGVDADVYESDPSVKGLLLTSIMKKMKASVSEVVENSAKGNFSGEPYVGTLDNGGVGIAPFHDYADDVDSDLSSELDTIKQGIIDGSIEVESPSSPEH